jgi:PKD repeat protein
MYLRNFLKLCLVISMAWAVAACKPVADFFVTPTPVIAGSVAVFDASATVITDKQSKQELEDGKKKPPRKPNDNRKVIYNWTFGDKTSASGITVTHTYSTAGVYTVTLTVIDRDGAVGVVSEAVVVKPAVAPSAAVKVQVLGADGAIVPDAQVSIGAVSALSDTQGQASLVAANVGTQTVIVSKAGYITQALQTKVASGATANLLFNLLPVKEQKVIANIQNAQLITASSLGASVFLPANALVNPDNTAAIGTVTLQLTPWDVRGADLRAMLGDGQAVDARGVPAQLISAGMMTVDFFNAAGQHLQLAAGKTATIQMNLASNSINNTLLDAGSTIPLWHFDPARGVWIEEGQGEVIELGNSPSGYAVKATVSHFSTWNWDVKFDNPGSVNVRCVDEAQQGVACSVVADVTLPDGSRFTKSGYADIGGTTIINMPTAASITWTGSALGGQQGTATSGASGNVVIQLSPPKTKNFVQCKLPNAVAVPCYAALSITRQDGSVYAQSYFVPATGATIATAQVTSQPLVWAATTAFLILEGTEYARYSGVATSGANGAVTINLTVRTTVPGKTIYVSCDPFASIDIGDERTRELPIDSCTISVSGYMNDESGSFRLPTFSAPAGIPVAVQLPIADSISIYAVSKEGYSSDSQFNWADIVNNQSVVMKLIGFLQPS